MPVIKRKSKEQEAERAGRDFATAYGAQRASRSKGYAQGGMAMPESPGSVAEAIMRRRKDSARADSVVDSDNMETPAKFSPYDDDNVEATLKEIYDSGEDQIGQEPTDSIGGPDEDEHDMDMVAKIRKRMRG